MKLYGYWRSSSAWRVRIALAYKNISHEYQVVRLARENGEQNDPRFVAMNPLAQVPVLELDARPGDSRPRRIAQSMAILEYLEENFPTPALLPADPWLRARSRQLAEAVNSGIQPFQKPCTITCTTWNGRADSSSTSWTSSSWATATRRWTGRGTSTRRRSRPATPCSSFTSPSARVGAPGVTCASTRRAWARWCSRWRT